MLLFELLLWLSAILKLDWTKGKSGGARPPRGMKLGNWSNFDRRVWVENFVQHLETCLPISITETDRVLWRHLVMLITIFFRWMYKMKYSCYQDYSVIHGWFLFQVFGWELHAPLDQVIGNPTSDGTVFVFNLAWCLRGFKRLQQFWPYLMAFGTGISTGKPEYIIVFDVCWFVCFFWFHEA